TPNRKGGKSSFTAKLMNIEAAANETFRYTTSLYNASAENRVYELKADLPAGWIITYRVEGNQVGSLSMDAGKVQDIAIEINTTATAAPKKYSIPLKAISASETLSTTIEAVVKGSYGLSLSTPSGRLSEELTSGSQKKLNFILKNTGTLPLNDVEMTSQMPSGWEASYEPAKIKQLEPGKSIEVTASLKVPDKTIAGDYAATFTAANTNTNSAAAFRLIVKTSLLAGWIGVLVILLSIGLVYYLIRKYGRR
ncbi:MAG TPA: NEW3 domain-containing protein, partial [Daejeonella sp.]|nr:NEW3 domain-containing protein [Daejeonella sp.]